MRALCKNSHLIIKPNFPSITRIKSDEYRAGIVIIVSLVCNEMVQMSDKVSAGTPSGNQKCSSRVKYPNPFEKWGKPLLSKT
jgi:hypothetical protein